MSAMFASLSRFVQQLVVVVLQKGEGSNSGLMMIARPVSLSLLEDRVGRILKLT
jgi:hypothetical protein